MKRCASTKQWPFPHRRLCCPVGSSSTTATSDAHPASDPLPEVIGYRTPRSGNKLPQVTGPGRASPVPAATIDTFRAPYTGESFTAAPRIFAASMAFTPISRGSALPVPTPKGRLSNDAAGFASRYGPHRRSPCFRAFDAGLRPRPFPDETASLLPGLLAATRTGLTPASDDELTNTINRYVTAILLFCWAHEKGSLCRKSERLFGGFARPTHGS